MQSVRLTLTGESPFVMQSDVTADPLHPIAMKLAEQTSVRKKTAEHHRAIERIEFEAGIYLNDDGPFIPADMFQKCLVQGARLTKDGKKIERGVMVLENAALKYKGPRDMAGLYADRQFIYRKTVVISGRRTARTRPIFREWGAEFDVFFDDKMADQRVIVAAAVAGGNYIGIGQRRPDKGGSFGRFRVEVAS